MLKSEEADSEAVARSGLVHRIHVPQERKPHDPIFVIVHGRTGDANVMWTFTRTFEQFDPLTVAPQGPVEDSLGGFSWWHVTGDGPSTAHTSIADPREVFLAGEKLEKFIDVTRDRYGAIGAPVYSMGFSQGGALLSSLALKRPALFSGVAMLASFIPKIAFEAPDGIEPKVKSGEIKLPPFFFAHGSRDEIVPLSRAEKSRDQLLELGAEVQFEVDDVGHKTGSSSLKALSQWFAKLLGESL